MIGSGRWIGLAVVALLALALMVWPYDPTGLAIEAFKARDYRRAVKLFSQVIARKPGNAWALAMRSRSYSALRKLDRGLANANAALKANPKEPMAHFALGSYYSESKKHELAIEAYGKAIQWDPNFADSYHNRSRNFSRLKRFALALQDINKALKMEAGSAVHYTGRGYVFDAMGELKKALRGAMPKSW